MHSGGFTLATVLIGGSGLFVLATLFFGTKGGYYDTDAYDDDGDGLSEIAGDCDDTDASDLTRRGGSPRQRR